MIPTTHYSTRNPQPHNLQPTISAQEPNEASKAWERRVQNESHQESTNTCVLRNMNDS